MKIPFLELKPGYEELRGEFDAAYHRVMDSGSYLLGKANRSSSSSARLQPIVGGLLRGLWNGLAAYAFDPQSLRNRRRRRSGYSSKQPLFIATWLAVSYAGATPVPVEPDPETFNIAPERITAAMSAKTKAVIPVHLYGQPADMDPILSVARTHGLKVIEDNAQAQGAKI